MERWKCEWIEGSGLYGRTIVGDEMSRRLACQLDGWVRRGEGSASWRDREGREEGTVVVRMC